MAKKRFRLKDSSGNVIPYDISAADVTLDATGQSLPEVLEDLEEGIDAAGQVNAIVMNGVTHTPTDKVIDLGTVITDVSDKVDKEIGKGLSTNDYTNDEKAKLAGLSNYDDTELQATIQSLQNALNALVDGGSVTDAIDTFNEVTDFLDGIDTSDPTLANQLKALNDAIKAVETSLGLKANAADVYTMQQANSTFATKQDLDTKQGALTPGTGISIAQDGTIAVDADDTPTEDSPKPVTSGGVDSALKTLLSNIHIGVNGNWWIGPETDPSNDTGIKAQGPKGNSVVDGDTFDVINNLIEGGEEDALSAEMGKVLRVAIMTIYNALGVYAFPNGKPSLNWGSTTIKHNIAVNLDDITMESISVNGVSVQSLPAQITDGQSLELTLSVQSNLYVIDDDNLSITMGGDDIKPSAYNASTGVVSIANVMGDVVITATAMTYVAQNNLAFHLDCKNVGSNSGFWTDLIGGIKFKLTDVTMADSGAVFNGSTSKAVVMDDNDPTQPAALGSKYVDVAFDAGTLEVIAEADSGSLPTASNRITCPVFINPKDGGIIAAFRMGGSNTSYANCLLFMYTCRSSGALDDKFAFLYNGTHTIQGVTYIANGGNNIAVGAHTNLTVEGIVRLNGETIAQKWYDTWIGGPSQTRFAVGYYYRNNNGTITEAFFKGKIKAIRVYSTKLTEAQMIQNYKVDKKRFNLQ